MKLYHFSEEGSIALFEPRAPSRHPESQPLVYAIDAWHSPLYLFPRDCPRIGIWSDEGVGRLFIQEDWVERWQKAILFRYELPPQTFVDCHDHGVWVSSSPINPMGVDSLVHLPDLCPWPVTVAASLVKQAEEFFDFETKEFTYPGHVSMIRLSNLSDWPLGPGSPVQPP